ncbi:MAG TPA: hydroxyacid dehydrogenase [Anaerolineales bacterium]|nr:hydroxyacid dehydrogenase [Anaerolineales bacterium]
MSNWKVLITDGLSSKGQNILSAACQVDDKNDISAEDLLKVIGEYDALIVRSRTKVTPEVFEAAKKLKVVGRAGVGVDNINLAAAAAHNVRVVNAPKSTSVAVAELALSLMLALAHSITTSDASMKSGQWLKKELKGVELDGKTLGIIGTGNIGSALAKRAVAMGMTVLGYDKLRTSDEIRSLGFEPVSLDELYARSDYISLHIPLTDESRNMINGQTIAQMKRGVRIICTARGNIIDETALLAALESGQVAGVGLDVYAKEPPGLTALVAHPKVVATPHIGAQTAEAQVRAAEDIASEILAALRGEPLRWKVV